MLVLFVAFSALSFASGQQFAVKRAQFEAFRNVKHNATNLHVNFTVPGDLNTEREFIRDVVIMSMFRLVISQL